MDKLLTAGISFISGIGLIAAALFLPYWKDGGLPKMELVSAETTQRPSGFDPYVNPQKESTGDYSFINDTEPEMVVIGPLDFISQVNESRASESQKGTITPAVNPSSANNESKVEVVEENQDSDNKKDNRKKKDRKDEEDELLDVEIFEDEELDMLEGLI